MKNAATGDSDVRPPNGSLGTMPPTVSDAEFDPRTGRVTNTGQDQLIDLTDPWSRYIADLEAGDPAESSASVVQGSKWPELGIKSATGGPVAEPTPAVVAPEPVPSPARQPAGTPGLMVMHDSMSLVEPTAPAADPSRPAPREQARTSAASSRAAARRVHRPASRYGSGGGRRGLFDRLRSGWAVGAGFLLLLIFGFILINGAGGSTPTVEVVAPPEQATGAVNTVNVMSAHAFQGAAVPVSSSAGPATIDEVRASGFAHTELGAAMAALHLSVRTDPYTGPAVFTPTIREQTSGATAAFLVTRQKQYDALAKAAKVTAGQPVIAPTGEMVGWKIPAGWKPDGPISVHLLLKLPNSGRYVDIAPTVVWDPAAADYRLVTSADGVWPSTSTTPEAGYTKFIS